MTVAGIGKIEDAFCHDNENESIHYVVLLDPSHSRPSNPISEIYIVLQLFVNPRQTSPYSCIQ